MSSTVSIGPPVVVRRCVSPPLVLMWTLRGRRLAEVRLDNALVRPDLGARALGDLRAVLEHGDALGHAHDDLHVVLDQEHRHVPLVADAVDERDEVVGLLRVHAGRRLVEQQQLRAQGQRAGHLEPALVAVREVLRELVGSRRRTPQNSISSRAVSRASCSSRRWPGVPRMVCQRPPLRCGCIATITFSAAVMVPNRRMFWNVRAMPSAAIWCGARPATGLAVEHRRCPRSACRGR